MPPRRWPSSRPPDGSPWARRCRSLITSTTRRGLSMPRYPPGVAPRPGDRIPAAHPLIGAASVESLPPGRRARVYQRLAAAAHGAERYAHFAALAAGPGPDPRVADALDAAAAAARARAANAAA